MSPDDTWTLNISAADNGASQLHTTDTSCTLPANINQAAATDRTPYTYTEAQRRDETREGYIEIIAMADIPPYAILPDGRYASTPNPLFSAITRRNKQVPCTPSVLATLLKEPDTLALAHALGLQAPSGTLWANYTIINVPDTLTFSSTALAIQARAGDAIGLGNIVYFPQSTAPLPLA